MIKTLNRYSIIDEHTHDRFEQEVRQLIWGFNHDTVEKKFKVNYPRLLFTHKYICNLLLTAQEVDPIVYNNAFLYFLVGTLDFKIAFERNFTESNINTYIMFFIEVIEQYLLLHVIHNNSKHDISQTFNDLLTKLKISPITINFILEDYYSFINILHNINNNIGLITTKATLEKRFNKYMLLEKQFYIKNNFDYIEHLKQLFTLLAKKDLNFMIKHNMIDDILHIHENDSNFTFMFKNDFIHDILYVRKKILNKVSTNVPQDNIFYKFLCTNSVEDFELFKIFITIMKHLRVYDTLYNYVYKQKDPKELVLIKAYFALIL